MPLDLVLVEKARKVRLTLCDAVGGMPWWSSSAAPRLALQCREEELLLQHLGAEVVTQLLPAPVALQ